MRVSSKFFTPPLSDASRWALLNSLGLSHFNFQVAEVWEEKVLSVKRFCGERSVVLLDGLDTAGLARNISEQETPLAIFRHSKSALGSDTVCRERSLWGDLFPSPLNRFQDPLPDIELEFFPHSFGVQLEKVAKFLLELEKLLSSAEFSLLEIRKEGRSDTLCFHYVRGRRMRVGLWDPQGSEPPAWRSHPFFESALAVLEIFPESGNPWDNLARSLQDLLDRTDRGLTSAIRSSTKPAVVFPANS